MATPQAKAAHPCHRIRVLSTEPLLQHCSLPTSCPRAATSSRSQGGLADKIRADPAQKGRLRERRITPSADAVIRLAELSARELIPTTIKALDCKLTLKPSSAASADIMQQTTLPTRQIRAAFDDRTITVYQAYSPAIAESALAAGRFVPPFRLGRMTWIKPSFLWMMYRSGWASKLGQERILAISITRDGFEWAIAHSALSHHDPAVYADHAEWAERKATAPVRIQWDPERSLRLQPLSHRAIQIGLSGESACHYVQDWTTGITDVTGLAHAIRSLVTAGNLTAAKAKLPAERPYPLPRSLQAAIRAS